MRNVASGARALARRISQSFDRLPIRLRLAGVSALLTFVILLAFALAVGSVTVQRIRQDFNQNTLDTVERLRSLNIEAIRTPSGPKLEIEPSLSYFADPDEHAVVRIFGETGVLAQAPAKAPWFGPPEMAAKTVDDYRVLARRAIVRINGEARGRVWVQYAKSVSQTEATIRRVELGLLLGVLGGTGLALFAGMMIARRAMKPIAELTQTAAEIAKTRDPSRGVPEPEANDEVAELARTLQGMLHGLDEAREETEATLRRQRQFVADASHELRTPLTSVLANLELLAESLHGEQGEAAASALRSSQRMRRLVADLLLLARRDAAQEVAHEDVDLAQVAVDAAAELGPFSERHSITLDVRPAMVHGSSDELHRVAINLIENALRHTPEGTEIRVATCTSDSGEAQLVVEDSGPGVDPAIAPTLFERFVRGEGDRGGSFGLGLAIVRAIAVSHGGSVALERSRLGSGARFVVRLPALSDLDHDRQDHRPPPQALVDERREVVVQQPGEQVDLARPL